MSVDALRHKLAYLADQVPPPLCELVRSNLLITIGKIRPQTTLPIGVWVPLEVDVLYALFRHRSWTGTPIVIDILVEFLATEYRLPQSFGRQLIEDQMVTLAAVLPIRPIPGQDRDFLEYIFVETATALSEVELIADLGIGSALIKKLRVAATTVMKRGCQASFVPDVDATISEIMITIARQVKATPWALDLHRLRFALRGMYIGSLSETGLASAFDMLTAIGSKRAMAYEHMVQWLIGHSLTASEAETLIQSLVKADLLYLSEQKGSSSNQVASRRYSLTLKACDLTATCYLRRYFGRTKDPLKKLLVLPGPYQRAAIEQLDDADLMISLLRDHTITLTPEGLRSAIALIAKNGHGAVCVEIIQNISRDSRNPWLRKAALESLKFVKPTELKRSDELVRAAREDSSRIVKSAATLTLIAMNEGDKAVDLLMSPNR